MREQDAASDPIFPDSCLYGNIDRKKRLEWLGKCCLQRFRTGDFHLFPFGGKNSRKIWPPPSKAQGFANTPPGRGYGWMVGVRFVFIRAFSVSQTSTSANERPDFAAAVRARTRRAVTDASVRPVTNCRRTNRAVKVRAVTIGRSSVPPSIPIFVLCVYFRVADIDECSRTSGICSNGVCENMMGTYQCVCDDGYRQTDQKFYCEGRRRWPLSNDNARFRCDRLENTGRLSSRQWGFYTRFLLREFVSFLYIFPVLKPIANREHRKERGELCPKIDLDLI